MAEIAAPAEYPMTQPGAAITTILFTHGRLALARLCALQGRHDEAVEWFAKARTVLDEQGARPLRAITDFDEALMHARRGMVGDRERVLRLLDLAVPQFEAIGMPGWLRRAEELRRKMTGC